MGDSGGEVNDSGEDIGPAAPNNVALTGFNVCYYLAEDPAYKALVSDGADALREDCESGSVAVKEFSASGGALIAESDSKPEDGSPSMRPCCVRLSLSSSLAVALTLPS